MTDIVFRFGPAEYAATLTLLLLMVCLAAPQPLARSSGMAVLGLMLGTQGQATSGELRDMTGLGLFHEDPAVMVACVGLFALLVPHIAQHLMPKSVAPSHAPRAAAPTRGARLWSTVYQCLGFWPAFGAFIATAGWLQRPAWTGPFAAAWCGGLLAWYGLTPDLLLTCVWLAVAGMLFLQLACPVVPLLVGMSASLMLEENLGRALLLSQGEWLPLVLHRPIVAGMLALGALGVAARVFLLRRGKKTHPAPETSCPAPG
ncbi:MAG: tripartite tricarboxylate transporter permease [Pseudomonadota bacterium]